MARLRAPKLFNVRSDPFERSEHETGAYDTWFIEHAFVRVPAQAIVGEYLKSFQQFPPRQRPASFSVGQAMQMLMQQKTNKLSGGDHRVSLAKSEPSSVGWSIRRRCASVCAGLPDTKIGTFTQELFDEAKRDGWIVVSMKDDWKTIFAPAKANPP